VWVWEWAAEESASAEAEWAEAEWAEAWASAWSPAAA